MKNSQLQEILYRYANTKGVGLPLTAEEMLNAISSWLVDTLPECIDIVTSTLPAGSQATATLSGSGTPDDHYIIKVGIPQGATGPKGATGPQGPQGTKGEQGEQGVGYNYMGNWVSQNEYHDNDNVTYNGTTYVCIEAVNGSTVTPDKDTTHWSVFAAAATKDNFPLSAQNQLYVHYFRFNCILNGITIIAATLQYINAISTNLPSNVTFTQFIEALKTQVSGRVSLVGTAKVINSVVYNDCLAIIQGRMLISGNETNFSETVVVNGSSGTVVGQTANTVIENIADYENIQVDGEDSVIALGINNGANALVLYADNNGVILDSDSETVMVQKMMSMTEKGTDFNALVSAMETNGYKVTK